MSPQPGRDQEVSAPGLDLLIQQAELEFGERFGAAAGGIWFAPGRVNLFGAHLDYNGGPVLPTAIDRGTLVTLRVRSDRLISFDARLPVDGRPGRQSFEGALERLPERATGTWYDYPVGVLHALQGWAREHGSEPQVGFDVLFGGNLPVGAGLSSSASICIATAMAVAEVWELELERRDLVQIALEAERGFVGVQCGIMDPFAVAHARPGHLLWLDCKDESFEHLPIDLERWTICVANSGVSRQLASGEFNLRVSQCLEAFEALSPHAPEAQCLRDVPLVVLDEHHDELTPTVSRRARHVVEEVARAFDAREALLAGDIRRFGALMTRAHISLKDLYEVSVPELDFLVETGTDLPGCAGGRLTGAGFGGCVALLVERGAAASTRAALVSAFEQRFGREPEVQFFGSDAGPRRVG